MLVYLIRTDLLWIPLCLILSIVILGATIRMCLQFSARKKLGKAIMSLGNMGGKPYDAFVAALGEPAERNRICINDANEMATNVTWRAGGYEIVLMFNDNDRCIRLVSESVKMF